jgi:pullulanase/glycogen debranching enzyme
MCAGKPEPLGPSRISESAKHGVNFALHSEHATAITLVLSDSADKHAVEVPLERSGNTWHVAVEGCPLSGVLYGFRVEGSTGWETGDRCALFESTHGSLERASLSSTTARRAGCALAMPAASHAKCML